MAYLCHISTVALNIVLLSYHLPKPPEHLIFPFLEHNYRELAVKPENIPKLSLTFPFKCNSQFLLIVPYIQLICI